MNRHRQTEIDRDPQKLPSTTSYYEACTKYFPVVLRTTKFAHNISQYYFVLHSLHKVNPRITKYFPVLIRTTQLAQSTSAYYFVLQSLHKVLPSTTSYYEACTKYFRLLLRTTKACTKYFPVLLRTTKLAQSTSQYYFVLQSLHKALQNRNFTAFFDDRTSFRAKGLPQNFENRHFT